MSRKSTSPTLSEVQNIILSDITKRRDSPQHLVKRVQIVLLTTEITDKDAARQLKLHRNTVRLWRHRWNAQQENFKTIEAAIADEGSDVDEKALKDFIVNVVLADDPYNGKRGKYTPEQIAQLYAIACEYPQDSGRPLSHWSCRELGDEMVKRGIVDRMPSSTVWDFLKSSRLETTQGERLAKSQTRG
jgi:putative transposase